MEGVIERGEIMPNRERLLKLALKGLEAERANIDNEIAQIKSELNPRPASAQTAMALNPATASPKKKTMSAAARKKISDAMKRRYAESNKAANVSAAPVRKARSVGAKQATVKRQSARNRLTAEGRKRLSELAKKRWVMNRKLGKTTL
jgi:hypothetical protein